MKLIFGYIIWGLVSLSCKKQPKLRLYEVITRNSNQVLTSQQNVNTPRQALNSFPHADTVYQNKIQTGHIKVSELLYFAHSMEGVPYKYGSIDPNVGFDCSGFITYVFNHFGIKVPRASVDFTNIRHEVPIDQARPGDLILFTGTDSTKRVVGHMGIILTHIGDDIVFIHSTSGKAMGVTETPFDRHYRSRYIKTIRILPENDKLGKL